MILPPFLMLPEEGCSSLSLDCHFIWRIWMTDSIQMQFRYGEEPLNAGSVRKGEQACLVAAIHSQQSLLGCRRCVVRTSSSCQAVALRKVCHYVGCYSN